MLFYLKNCVTLICYVNTLLCYYYPEPKTKVSMI